MGKVLRAVAVIGLAVGAAVLAAPTGGLSIGVASLLSTSVAVASAIVGATVSLIGSALLSLAFKPSTSSSSASPQTFRQSIVNARIVYGLRRAGGVIAFFHPKKVGKKHFRYFVIAIAGHRCAGANRFFLNDEVATVDGSGKVTSGAYAGGAWLWFDRGLDDAAAHPVFVAECDGKWTADHRGCGVAKLYAKFEMTDAVVEAGFPNMTVEVMGKDDVRDPRTGARGYLRNAVAVFYDWMAMPREDGGFGAYADEIPDDDWLSAMVNIADEQIQLRSGGTEERYAFDSVIEIGAAPSEVRGTFVTCCAGSYTYSSGKHLMRPGYWVPVSSRLEEDDLAGPISVPLLSDEGELASEVSGTFIDPATLYQPQPIPTRSVPADDIRQGDYDLPHITSHPRGQRILEIMLRRAQAEKRVSWPMNIMGLGVAAMDTVQLATPRYGLSNYAFAVKSWGLSSDFSVVLGLREENEDIYAWNVGMELLPGEVPSIAKAEPINEENTSSLQLAIATSFPIGLSITAAADGSIMISDHTRRYTDGHPDVAVAGTTIASGLAAGDFRAIGYDDPDRLGGAVTYILDADDIDARASPDHPGRHYLGYAIIPTAGSPPSSGGGATPPGGNCPTVDTPILMADMTEKAAGNIAVGDRVWTRHEATLAWGFFPVEAVEIVDSDDVWSATIGGKALRATGDHRVYVGEWVTMRDLPGAALVDGTHQVVKMTVTTAHTYVSNGILSHNIKATQPDA
ncbi:phage tail protein [Sphingomonas melonis]|uniref:phage tail protein n=1 Tax=Sphingomonas melonis TaxID=152682 RepID=UPI0035C843EF